MIILCLWLSAGSPAMGGNGSPAKGRNPETPEYSEAEVKARFKAMPSIVTKRYSEETRRRIRSYVYNHRPFAEDLLGRGAVYFPIIEQYLKQYNLPLELRILPIIETNFDPLAVSRAGATGLWQFMQGTAQGMGLHVHGDVDERVDIHRSTEAAVLYLARLYEKYQDWGLALAAYNCGPRHVNRAIKRGKSRDYWTIARFLPRETQKYVPKFLAASYLVHYYHEHQLNPAFPELDLQLTRDIRLPEPLCLHELARIAQTPLDVLNKLNPAYADGCLPDDARGPVVTLPKRAAAFVLGYLDMPAEGRKYFPELEPGQPIPLHPAIDEYLAVYYAPQADESLLQVANLFQVEESLLRLWNGLDPQPGFDGERELLIYIPIQRTFHLPKTHLPLLPHYTALPVSDLAEPIDLSEPLQQITDALQTGDFWLHTIGFGETCRDIARQYRINDPTILQEHNPQIYWAPGEIVRIPRADILMVEAAGR